ncbi:MAG: SgcJ/EcaC family oxidoreductase [Planctomycetia bacterium]|nr:SgcJ/EcaC family oxidoreductase [Planctomycetia bacterium]
MAGWCLAMAGVASAQAVVATQPARVAAAISTVEKAITAEAEATVKAFNAGDATALGSMFIEDAELVDENGNVTESRGEITALFKRFFERFPQAVLEMEVTDARAIGDELVIEEGIRRITADQGTAAAQVRYAAVRAKEGDRWPIASYREFSDDPLPTPAEMLAPLDWLVGEWVDESPEGRTQIQYQWSEDGNFLIGDYNLSVGGRAASRSTQRIGWDPVESRLRSWTFDSDGGFSEGEWMAVDDGWLVKSEATLPDGTTGSATISIRPSDQDHFVVESTDRIVAGAKEPDFKLVIARKPPAPAAAAAPGK